MFFATTLLHVLALSTSLVFGAPLPHTRRRSMGANEIAKRGDEAPHWVIYGDKFAGYYGPPPVDRLKGFNTYILCFWQTSGVKDKALEWQRYSPEQRAKIKAEYNAAGIKMLLGLFGDPDRPTSKTKADPIATADEIAEWVKNNDVDGVDVNYEDFEAFGDGTAIDWLIKFTRQLKEKLPEGRKIMSHAPVAPWFDGGNKNYNGGYLKINKEVGNLIDYYNIQFYNQGSQGYMNCDTLLNKATNSPKTSVFELAAAGVPLNKIVIGKPGVPEDAPYSGYIEPAKLAECLKQGKDKGWNGGVMVWQFGSIDNSWIQTTRSKSFPM